MERNLKTAFYTFAVLSLSDMASAQDSYRGYGYQAPEDLTGVDSLTIRVNEKSCLFKFDTRFFQERSHIKAQFFVNPEGQTNIEINEVFTLSTTKIDHNGQVTGNVPIGSMFLSSKDLFSDICRDLKSDLQELREQAHKEKRPEPDSINIDGNISTSAKSCSAALSLRHGEVSCREADVAYTPSTKDFSLRFKQENDPEIRMTIDSAGQLSITGKEFPQVGEEITAGKINPLGMLQLPDMVCRGLNLRNKVLWELLARLGPI